MAHETPSAGKTSICQLEGVDRTYEGGTPCQRNGLPLAQMTGRLVQFRHGDSQVLNCLESHPHLPLTMATSGAPLRLSSGPAVLDPQRLTCRCPPALFTIRDVPRPYCETCD